MSYRLGKGSKRELVGVDEGLIHVVERSIETTKQDFSVHDGLRTIEEQREYVRTGASHTMKSRHLIGEAVDLVPYINGKLRWEWEPIYKIARAVVRASKELNVPLVWGGVWDRTVDELGVDLKGEVAAYIKRRKRIGKKAFIDGPHYQLSR